MVISSRLVTSTCDIVGARDTGLHMTDVSPAVVSDLTWIKTVSGL